MYPIVCPEVIEDLLVILAIAEANECFVVDEKSYRLMRQGSSKTLDNLMEWDMPPP
jgi:hypothetical protein